MKSQSWKQRAADATRFELEHHKRGKKGKKVKIINCTYQLPLNVMNVMNVMNAMNVSELSLQGYRFDGGRLTIGHLIC